MPPNKNQLTATPPWAATPASGDGDASVHTSANCVASQAPILLQTAKMFVKDANESDTSAALEVRAILDPGSQRSYVKTEVQSTLKLEKTRTESQVFKTFGADIGTHETCDVVDIGIKTRYGGLLKVSVVVVPHICNPITMQPNL